MVSRNSVHVFERNDNSSKIIKVLNKGDIVIVEEEVKSNRDKDPVKIWAKIKIYPETQGWIPCCEDVKAYKESPVEILAKAAMMYENDPGQAIKQLNFVKKEFPDAEYYDYDETLKKYTLSEMADYYLSLANSCKRPRYYTKTGKELLKKIKSGIEIGDQSELYKYASCSFYMEETLHDYCYLTGKKYPPQDSWMYLKSVSGKLDWKSQTSLPYGIKVPIHYDKDRSGFVVFFISAGENGWSWLGICTNSGKKVN